MIVCAFIQHNHDVIFRPIQQMKQQAFESLLLTFNTSRKYDEGVIKMEYLNMYYSTLGSTVCSVTTSKDVQDNDVFAIIRTLLETTRTFSSIEDIVGAMDDIMNEYTYFRLNSESMKVIREMDSYEERVHNMVLHTKEIEKMKIMKDISDSIRHVSVDGGAGMPAHTGPLVTASVPVSDVDVFSRMKENIKKRCTKEPTKKVHLLITERVSMEMDREGNKRSEEVHGDMCVCIRDPLFKDITITMRASHPVKYSPNLQKDLTSKGMLRAKKSFPVRRSVALVKWTRKVEVDDFSFNLWLTNNNHDRSVMMDYEKKDDIDEIVFRFNSSGTELSNGECRDVVLWRCKDSTDNIEFMAKENVLPINVYYCGKRKCSVEVEKIMMGEESVSDYEVDYLYEGENVRIVE